MVVNTQGNKNVIYLFGCSITPHGSCLYGLCKQPEKRMNRNWSSHKRTEGFPSSGTFGTYVYERVMTYHYETQHTIGSEEYRVETCVTNLAEIRIGANYWFLSKHKDPSVEWYQIYHDKGNGETEYYEYEDRDKMQTRWEELLKEEEIYRAEMQAHWQREKASNQGII